MKYRAGGMRRWSDYVKRAGSSGEALCKTERGVWRWDPPGSQRLRDLEQDLDCVERMSFVGSMYILAHVKLNEHITKKQCSTLGVAIAVAHAAIPSTSFYQTGPACCCAYMPFTVFLHSDNVLNIHL